MKNMVIWGLAMVISAGGGFLVGRMSGPAVGRYRFEVYGQVRLDTVTGRRWVLDGDQWVAQGERGTGRVVANDWGDRGTITDRPSAAAFLDQK